MNVKQLNLLKIRENEVINTKTQEEDLLIRQQLQKLGEYWADGSPYIIAFWHTHQDNFCFDPTQRTYTCIQEARFPGPEQKTVISATEWLNRHGVFVPGQDVICWGNDPESSETLKRVYITDNNYTLRNNFSYQSFLDGEATELTKRDNIKSPFKPWEDIEEKGLPLLQHQRRGTLPQPRT